MNRFLSTLVAAALVVPGAAVLTTAAAPGASAAVKAGDRCRDERPDVYKIKDVRSDIKVAYAKRRTLSPNEEFEVTRNVTREDRVRSRFNVSGGAEINAGKLLVSASARVDAGLTKFNESNTARSTTVRSLLQNKTSRNQLFVVYKATSSYNGTFVRLACEQQPAQPFPKWVVKSTGSWTSYTGLQEGSIRCGAGTPGSVTKVVARRFCR